MSGQAPDAGAPGGFTGPHHRETLAEDLSSPGRARAAVAAAGGRAGLPDRLVELALLLTSELVSNAVLHGAGTPQLDVVAGPEGVRVAVSDASPEHPRVRVVGVEAHGGRGVGIVDRWADAWGVVDEDEGAGKTVWFEVRAS